MEKFRKFLLTVSLFLTAIFAGCIVGCDFFSTPSSSSSSSSSSSQPSEEKPIPVRLIATYEQSSQVFLDTALEDLRADLTVEVETNTQAVSATEEYTLSGTLAVGESVIIVTYTPNTALTTTFTVTVSEGNVHTHVFTNYVEDNNAKCGQDGTKTAVCDYEFCEEKDVLIVENSALAHVYTSYAPDGNAKCGQDGTKTAICDNGCGTKDTVADEGSALTHAYTVYEPNGDATCQKDGTKTATCDNGCGTKDTVADENSTVEHAFENYKLNDDAKCEEDGTKTGECKYGCGEKDTVEAVGSALGHSFKASQCERCPATNNLSITTLPTVTATYYGEKPTVKSAVVKSERGETVTDGVWSVTGVDYTASGKTETFAVSATATFTPTGEKYAPVSAQVEMQLTAVATYGGNYYLTVDGALSVANESNAGVVSVYPLGNTVDSGKAKIAKTISVVKEIKSGVTLSLPYSEEDEALVEYVLVSDADQYKSCAYGKTQFLKNQIYIAEGHTLANAGTIDIAGEVSGGASGNYGAGKNYANSVTAGRHAQINLGKNAKLTSTGEVNCYGFINEESKNNGSQFILDGGNATVVFTIEEYRGASTYFGMIDPSNPSVTSAIASAAIAGLSGVGKYTPDTLQTSPINRFYIASVTAKTTVKYGAEMEGHAVLFADGENFQTTLNIINTKDGIITLTGEAGYVEYKYDYATRKTDLDIYGDMTLNPLQLNLTLTKSASSVTTTVSITLTTGKTGGSDGVFFPVSDYFDVSLNAVNGSATVNALNQKVKLLPGAKLTVGEKVVVNANEIAVYANNDLLRDGVDIHYTTNTPAELTVKGTLNAKRIGGEVKVGGNDARLVITEGTTVVSKEIAKTEAGRTATISVVVTSVSLPYTGVVHSTDASSTLKANGATVNGEALGVKEYAVKEGKWCPVQTTVTYILNGGSASASSKAFAYGTAITAKDLDVPTRTNYEFLGWYTTENFASGTEFTGTAITKDIVVYAKWQQLQGKVLVEFKAIGSDLSDAEKTGTFTAQDVTETKKAVVPTQGTACNQDTAYGRYVVGYYADANGTVEFDFSQEITESTTVYVKWAQKIAVTIAKGANVSSYSVTVNGKTVSATTFYVVAGTEIKVTATGGASGLTAVTKKMTISESYGSKSANASNSLWREATATLTFTATGDTTISIVGS